MNEILVHASYDFGDLLNYHCEFYEPIDKVKVCRVESWRTLIARFPHLENRIPISVNIYYYDGIEEVEIYSTGKNNSRCKVEFH